MPTTRIDVPTPSRSYSVLLEDGILDRTGALLDELKLPARRFVVSSPLVWRLHGARLARSARKLEPILIPDGERNKQLPTVSRVYDALVKATADRSSTLITFARNPQQIFGPSCTSILTDDTMPTIVIMMTAPTRAPVSAAGKCSRMMIAYEGTMPPWKRPKSAAIT